MSNNYNAFTDVATKYQQMMVVYAISRIKTFPKLKFDVFPQMSLLKSNKNGTCNPLSETVTQHLMDIVTTKASQTLALLTSEMDCGPGAQ